MRRFLLATLGVCWFSAMMCFGQSKVLEQVNQLELQGHFKQAAGALTKALENKSLAGPERKKLEFELDRLERIKQDFPYTKEGLFAELQKGVKGLTAEEYYR